MDNKTIGEFILTLTSVVLGFVLGQSAEIFKYFKENREKKKSIRQLIDLELNKNNELLKGYWFDISKKEKYWYNDKNEFNFVKLGYSINDIPFPRLSRIVWDNNINTVPSVYKREEIKRLWDIYECYELLFEIKEYLFLKENEAEDVGLRSANKLKRDGGWVSNMFKSMHFGSDASALTKRFKDIMEKIIGKDTIVFVNQDKA